VLPCRARGQLLAEIRAAVDAAAPQRAVVAAVAALIEFARSKRPQARFLTNEPLAAGERALDARDRGLLEVERIIHEAESELPDSAATPDLPIRVLFGAVQRLLATRLRRGEPGLTSMHDELLDWVARYEQPRSKQRWRTLRPGKRPKIKPPRLEPTLREPEPLPPGRPRLPPEQVAEKHRQRILLAVAHLADEKGYNATTIANIAKVAKVDPRVFYGLFANKEEAFMGYHELGFQQLMAVTAGAFFEGSSWPDRSWRAGVAFAYFLEREPLIAHIGFVEAYAVGPRAVQRVEDSHVAFTIFLQEGYQYAHLDVPPGRVALEGVVTAIYELVYHETRAGRAGELSRMLGYMGMFFLAPFLGAEQTNRLIDAEPQ
jgi:AcrR family transcriptional regulator